MFHLLLQYSLERDSNYAHPTQLPNPKVPWNFITVSRPPAITPLPPPFLFSTPVQNPLPPQADHRSHPLKRQQQQDPNIQFARDLGDYHHDHRSNRHCPNPAPCSQRGHCIGDSLLGPLWVFQNTGASTPPMLLARDDGRYKMMGGTLYRMSTSKNRTSSALPSQNPLQAGRPWQVALINFCGPLPEAERGNTQILVPADHFTRWYDAIPIPNGFAATVARILDEQIFSYYGIPEQIHSDQGRQFESNLLRECCRL